MRRAPLARRQPQRLPPGRFGNGSAHPHGPRLPISTPGTGKTGNEGAPPRLAPLTQMAESTGRNRSGPPGGRPGPLRLPLGPQCALVPRLQSARGFGAGTGGTVVRYLKQSPGNKAGLCAPGKRGGERAAARRAGSGAQARAADPDSPGPPRWAWLNPFPPAPRGLPLPAATCLIEKRKQPFALLL